MGLVGGVMGLVLGGVFAFFDWRLVFLFPAVVGLLGYLLTSGCLAFPRGEARASTGREVFYSPHPSL